MMMSVNVRRLTLTGLLTCLGLLLPFVSSHAFGLPGTLLLPMHFPVLLCGLLCGPQFGAMCGLLVPILSSALTGMPPAFPMLPIMACELATYGFVTGLLFAALNRRVYPALLGGLAAGRIVYALVFTILFQLSGGTLKAASVMAAFTMGLPGIAIQIALIPFIVNLVNRSNVLRTEKLVNNIHESKQAMLLIKARDLILHEGTSCVVIKGDRIVHTADGRGVSPLIKLYEEQPSILSGAFVIDRIIGKAAAIILVCAGAHEVFGELMSISARQHLQARGITAHYGRCIDVISNRDGNGICPIEQSVLDEEDSQTGYEKLKATVLRLQKTG